MYMDFDLLKNWPKCGLKSVILYFLAHILRAKSTKSHFLSRILQAKKYKISLFILHFVC